MIGLFPALDKLVARAFAEDLQIEFGERVIGQDRENLAVAQRLEAPPGAEHRLRAFQAERVEALFASRLVATVGWHLAVFDRILERIIPVSSPIARARP